MAELNKLYIPCGYRCNTILKLRKEHSIYQPTLPFDNGFFSPMSIIRFMKDDIVDISCKTTKPCIKTEYYEYAGRTGILMQSSTYEEIDTHISKRGYDNHYLDATAGYYTLVEKYGFILAHYNWHKSSKHYTPKTTDESISEIQDMLTRRKERLFDMIEQADAINIVFQRTSQEEFLKIDDCLIVYDDVETTLTEYFATLTSKPITFMDLS